MKLFQVSVSPTGFVFIEIAELPCISPSLATVWVNKIHVVGFQVCNGQKRCAKGDTALLTAYEIQRFQTLIRCLLKI